MAVDFRKPLLKFHFLALILTLVHALFKYFTLFSLAEIPETGIKGFTALSGMILFFFYLRPFKKINFYFSFYIITAFLLIFGILIRGILGGIIISVILFPFIPDEKIHEENGFTISRPFRGFMSTCCTYKIKERKLLLFEKDYGVFEPECPIEQVRIMPYGNDLEINYFCGKIAKKEIIKLSGRNLGK